MESFPWQTKKLTENRRTASISDNDATKNNKLANKLAHQLAAQEVVVMTQVSLHDA